jgi:hypothetical protein
MVAITVVMRTVATIVMRAIATVIARAIVATKVIRGVVVAAVVVRRRHRVHLRSVVAGSYVIAS